MERVPEDGGKRPGLHADVAQTRWDLGRAEHSLNTRNDDVPAESLDARRPLSLCVTGVRLLPPRR
jgi:hypothetical protein